MYLSVIMINNTLYLKASNLLTNQYYYINLDKHQNFNIYFMYQIIKLVNNLKLKQINVYLVNLGTINTITKIKILLLFQHLFTVFGSHL